MKGKGHDHRTRVTKILIRKAFTQLLNSKPIQAISVKELCEKAGINRGTFYAHYRDIYDLMEQIEAEMTEDFQAALQPLLDATGPDLTPLKITTGIFQCLKDNADICTVTLGPYGDKAFARRLINLGQERCLESYTSFLAGVSRKQLEYFYAFICAGSMGLLEKWLSEGMQQSVEEIARMTEDIMMHGIGFLQQPSDPEDGTTPM